MARFSRIFLVMLCLAIGMAGLVASAGAGKHDDFGSVVAVFPPWWSPSRAFAMASSAGDVLDSGTFPFVLIVQSQRPGLGDRLRSAGVLLLLNPTDVGGCDPSSPRTKNV